MLQIVSVMETSTSNLGLMPVCLCISGGLAHSSSISMLLYFVANEKGAATMGISLIGLVNQLEFILFQQ